MFDGKAVEQLTVSKNKSFYYGVLLQNDHRSIGNLLGKKSKQCSVIWFTVSCFSFQINRNFNLVEFYSLNYAIFLGQKIISSFDGVLQSM
jgi:hypothetical protein